MSDMATCQNCGAPIERADKFCPECGRETSQQRDAISGTSAKASTPPKERSRLIQAFPWIFGIVQIAFVAWLLLAKNYADKSCPYGEDCARISSGSLFVIAALWVITDAILVAVYVNRKKAWAGAAASAHPGWIVNSYFSAVKAHDHARAWQLGGKNLVGGSYDSYTDALSKVSNLTVTIYSVDGGEVTLRYDARLADGTHQEFAGTYIVRDGAIVTARPAAE
ncbi:zinc ribbon domain-containing protein [Streptomyces sp. NPDC029041]|uniref:zinc ribbon domain-containing protein n=1 Tax=Streptomyces sp. NPDC029041 TaxID=3155727 RepID=UPI0033E2A799